MSRASELTAEVDLRRLGLFCNRSRLTPLGLLEKQPQEIHSLLVDTVTEFEKRGYAGSYLEGIVKGVKSWLSFNDVSLGERKIYFTDPDDTPTLREEKAPEPDELRKAFEYASPRTRAAINRCHKIEENLRKADASHCRSTPSPGNSMEV